MNSMQCLILYSHQNDDVLNKLAATALKAKTLKFQQIKLDTIFKTSWSTLKGRGEGKIFGGIFINHGVLHDNYQHSLDHRFRRTVDLFQRKTCRRRWLPTFTLEQDWVRNKDLKMVHCLFGSETSDPFNWRTWVVAALGKFDSSDSNKRFWQIFINVKIRKTKIWGLEELKMLFRFVEERILNIYKS